MSEHFGTDAKGGAKMQDGDLGWQVIGEVAIDSGRIALIDPQNDALLEDYWAEIEHETAEHELIRRLHNEAGSLLGLIVDTGLGDGLYPVEARLEDVEGTRRVAEVRIRFLPHPLLGYELPS